MIDGVIANMVVAVKLIQKVIDSMTARKFGRIVNITSGSVKMPLVRARSFFGSPRRAHRISCRVARSVAASNVTINFLLPGTFETERLQSNIASNAKNKGISFEEAKSERIASVPAKRFGQPDELGPPVPSCAPHKRVTSPGRIS